MEPDEPGADASTPGYFGTRLAHDPNRAKVWQHLTAYLSRWIAPDARVLELGAGWCDFANQVAAAEVVALDADATVESAARPGVTAVVGDCTDLSQFPDGRFDVVFASNLVEHLDRDAVDRLVDESHRVLAAGGRLILLQPNFRLAPGRYFDDYTHVSIWTDQSLGDFLRSRRVAARGGVPAVPAVDPEVARCRADLPRPVVPPLAGQAARRPDARGRPPR